MRNSYPLRRLVIYDSARTMTSGARRGAFIVIEGLDRSGKSTQSSAILARLHTHAIPAKLIKFPGTLQTLSVT